MTFFDTEHAILGRKTALYILIMILLFGAFVRIGFWGRQGVTSDEIYTLASSSGYNLHLYNWWPDSYTKPFDPVDPVDPAFYRNDILKLYDQATFREGLANNIQGPLYPSLVRFLRKTLNPNVLQLRIFSVLMGLLALPMAYVIGRQFRDRQFALLLTLVFAISGMQVYYSHMARLYTLLTLISLCATWAVLYIAPLHSTKQTSLDEPCQQKNDDAIYVEEPISWFAWGVLAVSCLLGMYLHYAFLFSMLFFVCFLLWQTRYRLSQRKPLIVCAVVIFLGCLPLFPLIKDQMLYQKTYGHFSATGLWSLETFFLALAKHLTIFLVYKNIVLQIIAGSILGLGIALGLKQKKDVSLLKFAAVWMLFSFVPLILIDVIKNTHYFRTSRYFLPMVPVLGLVYAYALENLSHLTRRMGLFIIILALMANTVLISVGDFVRFYGLENTPYVMSGKYINTYVVKGDLVLVSHSGVSAIGLAQYLSQKADMIGIPNKNSHKEWDELRLAERLQHVTRNRTRVWTMFKKPSKQLRKSIDAWMGERFEPLKKKQIQNDTVIILWQRREPEGGSQ